MKLYLHTSTGLARSVGFLLAAAAVLGIPMGNAQTVVWREYPPSISPASGLTDALAGGSDILGVRVLSGTVQFQAGNTYSGGTELKGGTHRVENNAAFGTGPISLQGGLMQFGDYTLANPTTLDGNYSFGYSGGSSYDGTIHFSQPLLLNGNYVLTHIGNGGGVNRWVYFDAGVADGGGRRLTINCGTYNNRGFFLGSGSTYTGATVVHGASLLLVGSLTSTSEIQVNPGGSFLVYYTGPGTDSLLGNSVPVRLRGGTFVASIQAGTTGTGSSETVGTVTLDYGHSTVHATGKRRTIDLTISSLVHNPGSSVYLYRSDDDSLDGDGKIYLTGLAAGFMGSWAIARRKDLTVYTDYDFAWYGGSGVEPMLANVTRPAQVEGSGNTNHVKVTSSQTSLTGNTSVKTLAIAGSYNNDLGGFALDVVDGGLLVAGGGYVITNGTLTSSSGSLHLYNMGASMNIHADIVGATDVSTVGNIRLNGSNSFTHDLHVNSGTLTLTAANTFNRKASIAPGAVLDVEYQNALSPALGLQLMYDGDDHSVCNMGQDSHVGWATTNDVFLARGQYTSANLPGFITGTGTLTVRRTGQAKGTVVIFK